MATVVLPKLVTNKLQLLIGQWENAPNLTALLRLIMEYYDEQVTDVINYLHCSLNIDDAEGVWLDFLASRLNLVRPTVLASRYQATFGFDSAGEGFNEARIRDVAALEPLLPIDDLLFRKLIKSRIIAMSSVPSLPSLRKAVDHFDTDAGIRDNEDMTVSIASPQHAEIQIAHDADTLPKPAGIVFIISSTDQFGFDDAGSGFNQGPIR